MMTTMMMNSPDFVDVALCSCRRASERSLVMEGVGATEPFDLLCVPDAPLGNTKLLPEPQNTFLLLQVQHCKYATSTTVVFVKIKLQYHEDSKQADPG